MKPLLTIGLALAAAFSARAQYQPPTAPETVYSGLVPGTKIWNTGTDTRSNSGSGGGFANFLNVTVSDHPSNSGGVPKFYWNGSHTAGTFGSLALPSDAWDPDVVMIENDVKIGAVIVYFSKTLGGYCMSWTLFNPPLFTPLSAPVLIQAYNPASDSLICINVDADNDGNYAVAYQVNTQTYCKTGTLTPGSAPTVTTPANQTTYTDHIQPDVSLQHSGAASTKVKIVGLRANRAGYRVAMRPLLSGTGPVITSAAYPAFSLNNPRIASPLNTSPNFAITMMRHSSATAPYEILFEAYSGTASAGSRILNNGSPGFPPSIASYVNRLPAISYVDNLISVGWHTSVLPAPPVAQNNTFVSLDLTDGSFMPTTPAEYLDICLYPDPNPASVLSLSGRYNVWGKSAAYEHIAVNKQSVGELVWVVQNLGMIHWRPSGPGQEPLASAAEKFAVYPNPATDFLTLSVPHSDMKYSYQVFDPFGRKVMEGNITQGKTALNVQQLAGGTYFVQVAGGADDIKLKFVKQ